MINKAPHCDQSILHAPGTCEYCDRYPEWQELRKWWRINFTGQDDPSKAPCPSTYFRPLEKIEKWPGNRVSGYDDEFDIGLIRDEDLIKPTLTTDRTDPDLSYGIDDEPVPQNKKYLVLSEEERSKGFVRPVRRTYVHWYMLDGSQVPTVVTSTKNMGGCGAATTMGQALAETYARDPKFYGATYCVGCKMHRPVSEFYWDDDHTTVGS